MALNYWPFWSMYVWAYTRTGAALQVFYMYNLSASGWDHRRELIFIQFIRNLGFYFAMTYQRNACALEP